MFFAWTQIDVLRWVSTVFHKSTLYDISHSKSYHLTTAHLYSSAAYAVAMCPSVRLSVCMSVCMSDDLEWPSRSFTYRKPFQVWFFVHVVQRLRTFELTWRVARPSARAELLANNHKHVDQCWVYTPTTVRFQSWFERPLLYDVKRYAFDSKHCDLIDLTLRWCDLYSIKPFSDSTICDRHTHTPFWICTINKTPVWLINLSL